MKAWHSGWLVAAVLVFVGSVAPVSAQESLVRAQLIAGEVPTDPLADIWKTIPPAEFPLSPQVHWQKRLQQAAVKSVKVRGVHNGQQIAFLLEYADRTQDPADAAAMEFMVGDKKAHFAHGQPMGQVEGGPVNIWYWRNDAPAAADMTAKGFGTLAMQAQQDVQAKGLWKDETTAITFKERKVVLLKDEQGAQRKDPKTGDPLFDEETKVVEQEVSGMWRVLFTRALTTTDQEDAQIQTGTFPNVAFAVWDGQQLEGGDLKESGSQKAITSWLYFNAEPPPDYSIYLYGLIAVVVAAGVQFVIIRKAQKGPSA